MQYVIWEPRLEELRKKVAPMTKRAARLGLAPVTITEISREVRETPGRKNGNPYAPPVMRYSTFVTVEVTGVEPVFEGWTFEAKVEHVGGDVGNLVTRFPGEHEDLPDARTVGPTCEHCGKVRSRKLTYYVRHEDGTLRHVGSTCLGAFLPSVDPQALASMLEGLGDFVAQLEGGGEVDDERAESGGYYSYTVREVLQVALAAIRTYGWVKAHPDQWMGIPTRDRVSDCLTGKPGHGGLVNPRDGVEVKWPEDGEAQTALDALRARPIKSDFDHNLAVVLAPETTDLRRSSLVAAAAMVYEKDNARLEQRKAERSDLLNEYFGTPGKREAFTLTVTHARVFEGNYGTTTLVKFRTPEGREATWFASGDRTRDLTVGATLTAKATVKRHAERNGFKETQLTRVAT